MNTIKICCLSFVAGLAIFAGLGVGSAQAQVEKKLAVALQGQQTSKWCWAASGSMIMGLNGTAPYQCDEANKRFSRNDCCNNFNNCVQGGLPEFGKYGHNSAATSTLSFAQMRAEIDAGRAMGFVWQYPDGYQHYLVAAGYKVDSSGTQWIWINDPWPVNTGATSYMTYADFIQNADHQVIDTDYRIYKTGTWTQVNNGAVPFTAAKDIAIGGGNVWVTNIQTSDTYPHYTTWTGSTWSGTIYSTPGDSVGHIAARPDGSLLVQLSDGQMANIYTNNNYAAVSGSAFDVAVGADGTAWHIGTAAEGGGYAIYKWIGSGWTKIPGGGVRIAVDPSGNAWVVNDVGAIYQYLNGAFRTRTGTAKDIGIGANGAVWIVGTNAVTGGYGIYKWNGSGWTAKSGAGGTNIAVDADGNAWITNSSGNVYRWQGD